MPTADRRRFVPRAIHYVLAQDYPNRELLILDDGADAVADLVPDDPRVRYVRLEPGLTLGEKRNECVRRAAGDLIMHWDDDDWMSPRRVRYQVETLLAGRAEVCGLTRMLFYELATGRVWLYDYPAHARRWLAGGSLLYTREFWRRAPFPDVQVASDTRFVYAQKLTRAAVPPDHTFYVAMIHPGNTSPKRVKGGHWKPWAGDIESILGDDLDFYRAPHAAPRKVTQASPTPDAAAATSSAAPEGGSARPGLQGGTKMRIGYVLWNFPALSETFIRREVSELCRAGHAVFVYTQFLHRDPLVGDVGAPRLTVRAVDFRRDCESLVRAAREDAVEHLHSGLMLSAELAAVRAARALQIPFTLTLYSGHDLFTARDPNLYRGISADPLCVRLLVEDEFMREWVTRRLGADVDKVSIIPNSFDTELYRLDSPRPRRERVAILAVARFVEKKGLVYLVEAFRRLAKTREDAELWLVGRGPEEARLRRAASGERRIKFLGAVPESETRRLYREADIFCLPCVQTARRDADGIPTTILEAMALELPVVTSDLLSAPTYVRHEQEGLLTPPGDARAIADALGRLCADADLRERLGRAGRERVAGLCDIRRNVRRLQEIMQEGRSERWRGMLAALTRRRGNYTSAHERYHDECRGRAVQFFAPAKGRLLDIGCGTGKMRLHMPEGVTYVGCDPLVTVPPQEGFPFAVARGEALPFADGSFDSVLLYCMLPNALSVEAVLAEAARVLRVGGHLYVRECVNDPNPIHLNHLSDGSLRSFVEARFIDVESQPDGEMMILLRAVKAGPTVACRPAACEAAPRTGPAPARPLASVCVTAYNREKYLRASLESALRQTYRPLEVIVVDDGSTDGTARLLEEFRRDVRLISEERNGGIARAKNLALRATSPESRYVAVLDSDDIFHPRFVERCVEYLESDGSAGLVYTDDILIDADGREIRRREAVEPWNVEAWLRSCNLRGDTWMARRELVMRTALHDEELTHDVDYDLFYQLLELTTFAHLREALVYYRQHEGQSGRQALQLAKCHAANLVKYGYSPEYAYRRARRNPEWVPAIREGLALGERLRARRAGGAGASVGAGEAQAHIVAGKNGGGTAARRTALALDGGEPVRRTFLPFGAPCLGEEEIAEVVETLRSGWIGTGPRAQRFEEEFAAYAGVRHAVSLNSCTAGLFLSLLAAGVGEGDEVITTPLTFAATVNVIEHTGARPVFVDVVSPTLNIDPARVERAITPRTRAILPVHFGGLPCDMDALNGVAESSGLTVIEDAAHAVGARYKGRMAGALARAASFSFYANKNLTTGEGGMLTTDDEGLAERVRLLRLHGLGGDAWRRFSTRRLMKSDVILPGYKFNMTDIAAGLGLVQLRRQEKFMETRERYAALYDEAFRALPVRRQPRPDPRTGDRHALHLYALILDAPRWRVTRDRVVEALLAENVGAAIHYRAVHVHPFYRDKYGHPPEEFPHAHAIGENILSLPLTPAMSEGDVADVIAAVNKVAEAYAT